MSCSSLCCISCWIPYHTHRPPCGNLCRIKSEYPPESRTCLALDSKRSFSNVQEWGGMGPYPSFSFPVSTTTSYFSTHDQCGRGRGMNSKFEVQPEDTEVNGVWHRWRQLCGFVCKSSPFSKMSGRVIDWAKPLRGDTEPLSFHTQNTAATPLGVPSNNMDKFALLKGIDLLGCWGRGMVWDGNICERGEFDPGCGYLRVRRIIDDHVIFWIRFNLNLHICALSKGHSVC